MNTQRKIRLLGLVAAVGAMLGVAGPAQALSDYGDVKATYTGRDVVGGSGGVFRFVRDVGNAGDTYAGTLVTNSPVNQFIGMCLEVGEYIYDNEPNTWTVRDVADAPLDTPATTMGVGRAADIAKLITLALGGNLANALTVGQPTVEALQIALWEVSTERLTGPGGYNLGADGIQSSNALAISYIAALNADFGKDLIARASGLFAITNYERQDHLVQVVPIPAAAWLLGSGLLGLFGLARRKQIAA